MNQREEMVRGGQVLVVDDAHVFVAAHEPVEVSLIAELHGHNGWRSWGAPRPAEQDERRPEVTL